MGEGRIGAGELIPDGTEFRKEESTMHRGSTDRSGTLVRGYAWHIYPDPATPGVFDGDNPFVVGDAGGRGRPPYDPPPGVVEFWQVGKNTPGVLNDHHTGNTYLAVTDSTHSPTVAAGWFAAPARLNESFELDQRGARWAHLVRIANMIETASGPLLDCEFQVDRS
jgi:hypothetical protein